MDDQQNGLMVSKPTPTRPDHAVSFYSNTGDSRFKQYEASSPISSFFNDQDTDVNMNSKTFSELLSGNGDGFMFGGEEKPLAMSSSSRGNGGFGSGGSFAERLAARGAASYSTAEIPRLSTARFKSMPPSSLPIPRSPYLSIPPGLSPTTLLDSPVLLSTSLALPSPTTGTFPLPPVSYESGAATSLDVLKDEDENCSGFAFKPPSISSSSSDLQPLGNLVSFGYSHPQASKGAEAESKAWGVPASSKTKEFVVDATPEPPVSGGTPLNSVLPGIASAQAASSEEQQQRQSSNFQAELSETNHNALFPPTVIERPSEDGYNWRKYGQKHVKGSEYPRSYYKCTHLNCPTKKKVERSLDGHVTEIVYKGAHNHPKPLPNRRMGVGAARATHEAGERAEGVGAVIKVEGGSSWGNTQLLKVNDATNYSQEWKNEGLDRSSSASVVTELSDPSSTPPRQNSCRLESSGTPEHSSVSASDDDDGRAPADKLLGDDVDEDESVSKRRKKENNTVDIIGATRTIREPRVVVQTTSDIDILDDGYRWRKYGQKVVKGNPNPRSYYKCTNAGCPVRKHVERASHDPKAVITTYEGKHNHDVPAARNSSHNSAGTGNGPSATVLQNNATSSTTAIALAGSQLQDTVSHFDGHPDLGNNYAKHNYMFGRAANSNLNSQDRNVGIADQGTGAGMGLGVFGLNNGHCERQQTEVPSSFSMHINPANHGFAGNGFNDSIQSFFGQTKERDGGLIRPKEEQKDNFCFETSFH